MKRKRIKILSLLMAFVLSIPFIPSGHALITLTPGFNLTVPNGTLTVVTQNDYVNSWTTFPNNNTILLSVSGLETTTEIINRIIFTATVTGQPFTVTVAGRIPAQVVCTSCTFSYNGVSEVISYTASQTAVLIVIWVAVVNSIQAGPVIAFPMDTALVDTHGAVGSFTSSNNIIRMIDTTPFHNDAKPCNNNNVTSYVFGANAGAQLFTGPGQCWTVASNSNIHGNSFGNYLTISLWVRFDTLPTAGQFSDMIIKPGEYALFLSGNTGKITFAVPQGASEQDVVSTIKPGTNTFYHIAGVWDGTQGSLFINGRNDTNPVTMRIIPTPNSNALQIGDTVSSGVFAGILDEVYIFKRPLSQQEIGNLMIRPMTNRPISAYLPDTRVGAAGATGCAAPCSGFNQGNPELAFAKSSAGADGEINSTTYLPGPILVHQILNISITGANTNNAACPLVLVTLGTGGGTVTTNICDRFEWTWDFFHQGVFQSEYGIRLNILNGGGARCNTTSCSLWIDSFSVVNGVSSDIGWNNNNATTTDLTSYWVGIDMNMMQDGQHVDLRVTNYNQAQSGLWCSNSALLVGVCRQFSEGIFALQDSSGNVHTADWFDPYVQQNVEVWAQHAAGATTASIVDHLAGYTIDGICFQVSPGGSRYSGSEFDAIGEIINWIFQQCGSASGTSGGVNLPSSVPCLFNCGGGGGGQNCGGLNFICDTAGSITQALLGGLSGIFAPIELALNGLANGVATTLVSVLAGAWQLFAGGIDNTISIITGGRVINGFTNFWNNITTVIVTLETNATTIINGSVTGFGDAVTIISSLITFFAGSGTNILGTLSTVLSTVLLNNAVGQWVTGVGNLLLSLFGKGNGPNHSQFTYAGVTYDWGPGAQLLGNTGFQTMIILFILLWLLMNTLRDPFGFGHQMGSLLYYWGHVLITILAWFFDFFMKVVSWFKSLIPTWGSSW